MLCNQAGDKTASSASYKCMRDWNASLVEHTLKVHDGHAQLSLQARPCMNARSEILWEHAKNFFWIVIIVITHIVIMDQLFAGHILSEIIIPSYIIGIVLWNVIPDLQPCFSKLLLQVLWFCWCSVSKGNNKVFKSTNLLPPLAFALPPYSLCKSE